MSGMTHGEYMRALRDGKATKAHSEVKASVDVEDRLVDEAPKKKKRQRPQ